jgi:hypothetical protein
MVAALWHHRHVDSSELRVSNAEREQIATRLRTAHDEGRLTLDEYDERLQKAYAARTYAELNALLTDLPGPSQVLPAAPGALVPGPDGRYPSATRRWIAQVWLPWLGPVLICTAIWGVSSLAAGTPLYFWPIWVMVPWGVLLIMRTVRGLAYGEPQQSAERHAERAARREIRRQRRG